MQDSVLSLNLIHFTFKIKKNKSKHVLTNVICFRVGLGILFWHLSFHSAVSIPLFCSCNNKFSSLKFKKSGCTNFTPEKINFQIRKSK